MSSVLNMGLTLISIIYSPAAGNCQVKSIFSSHGNTLWFCGFTTSQKRGKTLFCFIVCWYPCRMLTHTRNFGLFICMSVSYSLPQHRNTVHRHRHIPRILFGPFRPLVCVSLFVCQHIVSMGWGYEVVSCKAWPFLPLAHTYTNTQIHKYTLSLCLYLACPIPVALRCYLSLTCQGCQVLMDGKQIGWRSTAT